MVYWSKFTSKILEMINELKIFLSSCSNTHTQCVGSSVVDSIGKRCYTWLVPESTMINFGGNTALAG
jgi:hypothetical protein